MKVKAVVLRLEDGSILESVVEHDDLPSKGCDECYFTSKDCIGDVEVFCRSLEDLSHTARFEKVSLETLPRSEWKCVGCKDECHMDTTTSAYVTDSGCMAYEGSGLETDWRRIT